MYIYQHKEWPYFSWNSERLNHLSAHVRHSQGRLLGGMETLGFRLQGESLLQTLTQDVVKTSEIEGEILDPELVRSSIARHLGLESVALKVVDRNIEGVVEMLLDATQQFGQPLTKERLLKWHRMLFPTPRIKVGMWRTGSIQVVSGPMSREVVHFEGPPAQEVDGEMERFLDWFNQSEGLDPLLKAALAHLWFVTIHPFEDGNGRIGRAIVDLVLARSENSSQRFYSLSAQIQVERRAYYAILEQTQKDGLEVTPWIEWFFGCLERAIAKALKATEAILYKGHFWEGLEGISLNERQRKVINRLLDGFEGKLTSSKWAKLARCSQDTAYRDILDLVDHGILIKNPEGGRSTSYSLKKLL